MKQNVCEARVPSSVRINYAKENIKPYITTRKCELDSIFDLYTHSVTYICDFTSNRKILYILLKKTCCKFKILHTNAGKQQKN